MSSKWVQFELVVWESSLPRQQLSVILEFYAKKASRQINKQTKDKK